MKRSLLRWTLFVLLALSGLRCSNAKAESIEVEAVRQLAEALIQVERDCAANESLHVDVLLEERGVFRDWHDVIPPERFMSGLGVTNETAVLCRSLRLWYWLEGEQGIWKFSAAPEHAQHSVVGHAPNGQELAIYVHFGNDGWEVAQIDPLFQTEVVRDASAEEFARGVLDRMIEIESAFQAYIEEVEDFAIIRSGIGRRSQQRLREAYMSKSMSTRLDAEAWQALDYEEVSFDHLAYWHAAHRSHRELVIDSHSSALTNGWIRVVFLLRLVDEQGRETGTSDMKFEVCLEDREWSLIGDYDF